jgi:hypothetical protein
MPPPAEQHDAHPQANLFVWCLLRAGAARLMRN